MAVHHHKPVFQRTWLPSPVDLILFDRVGELAIDKVRAFRGQAFEA
jgi:hypothetical protein